MIPKSNVNLRRVFLTIAIIYVLFCISGCVLQRKLLYFPTIIPTDVVETVAKNHGFLPWKNPAGEIIGWRIPANTNATASVLIVHGNAGCALGRDYIAQPIHDAAALDVYVLEYPGYGARAGSPTKASFVAAAEDAFQLLPKDRPRYVVSESIGAGIGGELAKNHPSEIAGLAMFVPYRNLASVAQRRMWFLPAYIFLLDRFDPEECLKHYHGPVKFIIAGADEIIGAASGLQLANGYAAAKEIQVIPGAHHNDVAEQSSDWWREVFGFWLKNATKNPE